MALNAYMRLTADTHGDIKGSVTQSGREDSIMVIAWSHGVRAPIDAASGTSSGKRQHLPLTITKEVDASSPALLTLVTTNENITKLTLQFWRPASTGLEEQHYTIELTNASVATIRSEMLNNRYAENMPHLEREHVSFTYQKITQTWNKPTKVCADDWQQPEGS